MKRQHDGVTLDADSLGINNMKGYHYTSYKNWKKIKKYGLIPYIIKHPDIMELIPVPIHGIFTWKKDHKGDSHIGSILFQKASKNSNRIVKLCFDYKKEDIFHYEDKKVQLYHYGEINTSTGFFQHKGQKYHKKEEAYIITSIIEPKNIRLVGDYDLLKLLK